MFKLIFLTLLCFSCNPLTYIFGEGKTKSPNILFRIHLYPSLQTIKSVDNIDEQLIANKRNSTVSSSCSSTFSLIENADEDMELFPQLNQTKPRLAMQSTHQIQY